MYTYYCRVTKCLVMAGEGIERLTLTIRSPHHRKSLPIYL